VEELLLVSPVTAGVPKGRGLLSLTVDHRDGERFRVTSYRFFVESLGIAADGGVFAVAPVCRAIEPISIAPQQLLIRRSA
jgi:hypothetical protein